VLVTKADLEARMGGPQGFGPGEDDEELPHAEIIEPEEE
jgi:hypothetical protein